MASNDGWVCENGHRVPDKTTSKCPDCAATHQRVRVIPPPVSAAHDSGSVLTGRRTSDDSWRVTSAARSNVQLFLIGGFVGLLIAGAIVGASLPEGDLTCEYACDEGSLGGLIAGLLLAAASQIALLIGVIAIGVRLGFQSATK